MLEPLFLFGLVLSRFAWRDTEFPLCSVMLRKSAILSCHGLFCKRAVVSFSLHSFLSPPLNLCTLIFLSALLQIPSPTHFTYLTKTTSEPRGFRPLPVRSMFHLPIATQATSVRPQLFLRFMQTDAGCWHRTDHPLRFPATEACSGLRLDQHLPQHRIEAESLRISRYAVHSTSNDKSYLWWVDSREGAQPSGRRISGV